MEKQTDNELEFLRFFYSSADFGPADDDVHRMIEKAYVKETGNPLPEGYRRDE